jgi:hypothetical protein
MSSSSSSIRSVVLKEFVLSLCVLYIPRLVILLSDSRRLTKCYLEVCQNCLLPNPSRSSRYPFRRHENSAAQRTVTVVHVVKGDSLID